MSVEQDEKDLKSIAIWEEQLAKDKAAILARQGATPSSSIASVHRVQDERATLYDRMTSAELLKLFREDREEWEKVMSAKEAAGMRKLFERR